MSVRGRALHALLRKLGRSGQSEALPTRAGDVVLVGADHALLGGWPERLPDVPVRALGERVLLTRELPPLIAHIVDPRALVVVTGTTDLMGFGGSRSPARAAERLADLLDAAPAAAKRGEVLVVGVPRRGWDGIERYNELAAAVCRARGVTFIEPPAVHEPRGLGFVLDATSWDPATYAAVASAVAETLGTAVADRTPAAGEVVLEGGLIEKSRQLREELFRALPSPRDRVVLLGDSITEGGAWDGWLPALRPVNRGISGNRITQVVERLDTAVDAPAAISVLIGTNDLATGDEPRDPDAIAARFHGLITEIRDRAPGVPLVINSVMPRKPRFAEPIARLNTHYRETAAEFGAEYVDLWPAMATSAGRIRPELTLDGLHLNAEGYRVWTDLLRPALERAVDHSHRRGRGGI